MYEVFLSEIIYCLFFYFKTILIPFFRQIYGISFTRAKEFINYWTRGFKLEEEKASDERWREILLIDGFNVSCNYIAASFLKVGDESMSVICFRTTAEGNLPHLSYMLRNPEPLRTEFKTVVCFVKGALILIEVQRGKEDMNYSKYQKYTVATTACTKRVMEEKKGIGQKSIK